MERSRIEQVRWLLDDYLDELASALQNVTLEEDEESLGEKMTEVGEVIEYLDRLLDAKGENPNRVMVVAEPWPDGYLITLYAERPDEVIAFLDKSDGAPRRMFVQKLNTVKEEA